MEVIILIMWSSVKKFISKNRYKIAGAIGVAALAYFTYNLFEKECTVKLSAFIKALKGNYIQELVIEGQSVYFRSNSEEWYHALLGRFPLKELYQLIG